MSQSDHAAATFDRDRLLGRMPGGAKILAGKDALLHSLQAEFQLRVDLRNREQRLLQALHPQGGGKEIEAAVAGLRKLGVERRARIRELREKAPRRARATTRLTASHVPVRAPFPYDWAPTPSINGNPEQHGNYADKSTGKMGFSIFTNGTHSAASCSAGIGAYFVPTGDGLLRVSSNPTLTIDWVCTSVFSGSHSEGRICLFAQSYLLDGTPDEVLVDQRFTLWSADNTGEGHGVQDYPLSAEFTVNNQRFYEVFVWCNGEASDGGSSSFTYGDGISGLDVVVPEITFDFV